MCQGIIVSTGTETRQIFPYVYNDKNIWNRIAVSVQQLYSIPVALGAILNN